jgi:hypothetical protein
VKPRITKDIVSETRDLFDQLSGEARRLAERDRHLAQHRGPVAKALLAVCVLAGCLATATLIYGFVSFSDGPIRQSSGGYVGKHGAPHTREHFERYKLWEKLMVASFGLTFLASFGAVAAEKRYRQRRGA